MKKYETAVVQRQRGVEKDLFNMWALKTRVKKASNATATYILPRYEIWREGWG